MGKTRDGLVADMENSPLRVGMVCYAAMFQIDGSQSL